MGTLNVSNLNVSGDWSGAPAGTIVQTVANIHKDQSIGGASRSLYISSGSYTYSGASVSITPKISGSTIVITATARIGSSYGSYINHNWQILDNSGNNLPDYESGYPLYFYQRYQTGDGTGFLFQQGININVTSAQTYKLYGAQSGGNGIYIFEPVIMIAQEISA